MASLLDLYLSQDPMRYLQAQRWSTFFAVLRDARNVTGRDADTGDVVDEDHTSTWVGTMGYLAFADQVGRAITRTDLSPARRARLMTGRPQERPFRSTFVQFTDVRDDHIDALYALRCALMHVFGLVNQNDGDPRLRHKFVLSTSACAMVRLPVVRWDGKFARVPGQSPRRSATHVNVRLLGDAVEEAARRVKASHAAGKLEKVPASEAEFLRRFTFRIT
jgi:hypothetical protein